MSHVEEMLAFPIGFPRQAVGRLEVFLLCSMVFLQKWTCVYDDALS
ncbi:hypothetical protein EDC15_12041 [Acetobacter aceti NBRC 14818]|nr:hypothetical protein EDC15_12041 [Acetobacter aceti NBRC 14818]